jgi:hypothetical protein
MNQNVAHMLGAVTIGVKCKPGLSRLTSLDGKFSETQRMTTSFQINIVTGLPKTAVASVLLFEHGADKRSKEICSATLR